jgi:transcriptional regulator with GAF, ATPase, and Fis domain
VSARTARYSRRVSRPRGQSRPHTEATLDPARPLAATAEALGPGRYAALYETGRQLLEQRHPRQVLDTVLRALLEHLQPDRACVLARNADGGFRAVSTHGLELSGPAADWPLSWTVVRQVVDGGLAVLASDARSDPQFEDAESIQRFRIRSILCVPLGAPARGVVYLDNRSLRPFKPGDLEFVAALGAYAALALDRALELSEASEALQKSAERLDLLQDELLRHRIVGSAPPLLQAYDALRRFAKSGARVLLRGETGTGKELFARAYAAESGRARAAYVPVPIPALAPGLVESELFGHVRGAFTEATRDKKGRLEVAHGGVLFLDEIGDIEPALQVKLLRFLDSGELYRVGDNDPRRVDALVVSATNRPLEKDVEQGRFRADLLARLGHAIRIPPLRERPEDIPELVAHFLSAYDRGPARKTFAPETLARLQRHTWPFNVRELQQVVESAVCLVDRPVVTPEDLPEYMRRESAAVPAPPPPAGTPEPLRKTVEAAERAAIVRALEYTGGNRRRAIELLQISPETFYRRLEEFGLHKKG